VNTLVVARHEEDVAWLADLPKPWQPLIVQKDGDIPNEGREGASFAYALAKLRAAAHANDLVACVQGDPFPHCIDLFAQLGRPPRWFRWFGDPTHLSDAEGAPHHPGLPMRRCHEEWLGREWPGDLWFAAGGQFMVAGRALKRHPAGFYRRLQAAVCSDGSGPWVMERLWAEVFGGTDAVRAAEEERRRHRRQRRVDAEMHRGRAGEGELEAVGDPDLQSPVREEEGVTMTSKTKKKTYDLPAGWVLTTAVEADEDTPGDFRAFKVLNQATVDQHTQSYEAPVAACAEYNRLNKEG